MAGTATPGSLPGWRSRSDRFTPPDGAIVTVPPASPSAVPSAGPGDPSGTQLTDPASAPASATAMAAAVLRARGQLGQLRQRFLRGYLPPLGHLIVRHRLVIPGGSEAPWVLARSWRARAQLEGRCLNDAVHPSLAHIRMGRAVVVDVDQIVDWAIVDAFGSIIDGGWSRDLRWAPPPARQPPPARRPPLPTEPPSAAPPSTHPPSTESSLSGTKPAPDR